MKERSFSNEEYRFGFNGKEDDGDFGSGIQDYGMRIYCKPCGRFLSVDPLAPSYPELTTYQFASNTPIAAIDLDGLEALIFHSIWASKNFQKTLIDNGGKSDIIINIAQAAYAFKPFSNKNTEQLKKDGGVDNHTWLTTRRAGGGVENVPAPLLEKYQKGGIDPYAGSSIPNTIMTKFDMDKFQDTGELVIYGLKASNELSKNYQENKVGYYVIATITKDKKGGGGYRIVMKGGNGGDPDADDDYDGTIELDKLFPGSKGFQPDGTVKAIDELLKSLGLYDKEDGGTIVGERTRKIIRKDTHIEFPPYFLKKGDTLDEYPRKDGAVKYVVKKKKK